MFEYGLCHSQTGVFRSLTHISEFLQESVLRWVLLCSPFMAPLWLPPERGSEGWEVCLWPGHASVGSRCCVDCHSLGYTGIPSLSSHSRSLLGSRTLPVGQSLGCG